MKVYLDYHSTTPLDKRVYKAMKPFFFSRFGNPAAAHFYGEDAAEAVDVAKEQVADLIRATPDNICFTNSATEANNIVLNNWWGHPEGKGKIIITTNVEHSSIVKYIASAHNDLHLELKIDSSGQISLKDLEDRLSGLRGVSSALVSIMAANNEIGTIYPLKEIGDICKKYEAFFHTDATQAIGKVNIDVDDMNISALTMSAHKIYGPKGVGALYLRDVGEIRPLIHGGYQNTVSSGTQNVPAIVGMGEACRILQLSENTEENKRIEKLRDFLLDELQKNIPGIIINGTMKNRLPNNLNVAIKDIKAEALIKGLDDMAISGGSACTSGNIEPSHVILALGSLYPDCSIRFGLGRWTTKKEIKYAVKRLVKAVETIRSDQHAEKDRHEE